LEGWRAEWEPIDRRIVHVSQHPRGSGLRKVRTRDMLLQLIAEDLQHRGELNGLLWQMDTDVPFTNFIDWSERRRSRRG
jgi:uncharacterized damage-inducible protein DinB